MALTRATRHILSERVLGQPRRDYEKIGADFRFHVAISAGKPDIDPEWSVKALNGATVGGNKDSEKRTAGTGVKEQVPEIRFAPNKKRAPGDVLKLHVTAKDMLRPGTEPNFGWVSKPKRPTPAEARKNMEEALAFRKKAPKIIVHEYEADPRTGTRIEESKRRVAVKSLFDNVEAKALGRSLSSYVPGGNIGSRAASKLGVIVDELGKFRCPPGTPAANQFTDEFGTNCFAPTRVARRMLGRLGSWYNNHAAMGRYLEMLEAGPDDPRFAKNRRAMEAASQMLAPKAVFDQRLKDKDDAIETLRNMLGASGITARNEDLWDTLSRMRETGMWDVSFENLFTGVIGAVDVWDPNRTLQENLDALDVVLRDEYLSYLDDGIDPSDAQKMVDILVDRHYDAMRGFMEGLLHEFHDDPETMRQIKTLERTVYNPDRHGSIDAFWSIEAEVTPIDFQNTDGFGLTVEFNPAAVALRPMIEDDGVFTLNDGKIRIVSTDGSGSEGAQWQAMQSFFRGEIDLERWKDRYANDISAARHQSLQAAARHVAYHEMGHVQQYSVVKKTVIDQWNQTGVAYAVINGVPTALTDPPDQWDNQTWMAVANSVLQNQLPEEYLPKGFPPIGIHAFEGTMLHILSGRYYQDMVQQYWGEDGSGVLDPAAKTQLAVMLMEGMTELRALQKMGVLDSELIDQNIEWMNGRSDLNPPSTIPPRWTPPPSGPPSTPTPPGNPPTNPPNTPPGNPVPDDTALDIIPSGITWMVDKRTGEIQPTQGPWDLMERYFIARFGGRPDDKTGGHQEIPRKSIAKTWQWSDVSYAQLSGEDLDRRFEILRTDADGLIERLDAGEQLEDDDLAKLWLAAKGMQQIADENARRRNANADIRQQRSEKFERNDAGRIFRASKKPYKRNAQDGDEIYDEDKYRQAMIQIEDSIPARNPSAPQSWTRDPAGYGSEQAMDARRPMTAAEQAAMTKDMKERNKRYVHGGVDLEEAIERAAKVRGDTHDVTQPHPSPAREVAGTVLPMLDAMERSPLKDTVEGYVENVEELTTPEVPGRIGQNWSTSMATEISLGFSPEDWGLRSQRSNGFIDLKVVSAREESNLDYGGGARTKVVVPKGSRGLWREDDDGDYARLTLPPGDFEVVEDVDGVRTLIPRSQESAADFADRLLSDMDEFGKPRSVAEMRERAELQKILQGRRSEPQRHVRSHFSDDPAVRNRMIKRRNDMDRGFANNGIEPFNPDFSGRDRSLDQSSATRMMLTSDRLADGDMMDNLVTSDGKPFNMTPEARDFIERSGSDAINKKVTEAAEAWHEGVDRRVRSRMDATELDDLLENGAPTRSERGAGLLAFERNAGWPDGAPNDSRPMFGHATHAVHEDIVDDILADAARGGFPALRRAGFFDHSSESPHGPLGSLGEADVVLRPEVSMRSAYGLGDILRDPVSLTRLNDTDPRRYGSQLAVSRRGDGDTALRMGNLLHAGLTGDFRGVQMRDMPPEVMKNGMATRLPSGFGSADIPMETAIAGGFNLEDVERIDVPINSLGWQRLDLNRGDVDFEGNGVSDSLRNAGWSNSEIDFLANAISSGQLSSVKSANLLRQHRVADADRIRFDQRGLNVRYTNPDGIDLFSKRDLTVGTDSGARIGRVRDVEDALQIRLNDEVMARQATLRPVVQEGMRSMRDRVRTVVGDRISQEAADRIGRAADRLPQASGPRNRRGRIASRIIGSKRVEKIMRDAGLDDDNVEMIQLVGEMAAAFSGGGPAGVGIVLARRAGREGIDAGVRKALQQGWLSEDQARKILFAADRVAPEGLPDAVTEALGDAVDKVADSELADRARLIGDAAVERVRELGIGDRLEQARDDIRRRLNVGGRREQPALSSADPFADAIDVPSRVTTSTANDPFASPTGLRSARRTVERFPQLAVSDEDTEFRELDSLYRQFGFGDDAAELPVLERIRDALGEDFEFVGGWGSTQPLGEVINQGWGDRKYLSLSGRDADSLLEALEASDLDDGIKDAVREDLKFISTLGKLRMSIMDTRKPPGRDPFGDDEPFVKPEPSQVRDAITTILDNAPDSFGEVLQSLLDERRVRVERVEREKNMRREVESDLQRAEYRRRYGPNSAEVDRSAPVGQATRVASPKADVADHEPVDGVTRSHKDIEALMQETHAIPDSLLDERHREELISLLTENEEVQRLLAVLEERRKSFGVMDYSTDDKTGSGYAGRELVDALIQARGYDAKALRVTEEEMDLLHHEGGFTPMSRGGHPEMQRRTIENEELPIGEGVDGAGLYFAVQGAHPDRDINEHFQAEVYAGESGQVMRAAVSPTARLGSPIVIANQVEQYRREASSGPIDENIENNPLIALRRSLSADPANAKAVEALDAMLMRSNDGENLNSTSIAAILQGYDGLSSTTGRDNRIIIYNRSAMAVSRTLQTGAEYAERKPWERLQERAEVLAAEFRPPANASPEEYTQWVLDEVARRLESLDA